MSKSVRRKPKASKSSFVSPDEAILGKDVLAERMVQFPAGIGPGRVSRISDADKASIRASRFARISELAKHFGVSVTTIRNVRKS